MSQLSAGRLMRIGLTGGIAAGKSVASRCFADLGVTVIDYDVLAHQSVAAGSAGLAAVAARFGPQMVTSEGTLDRAALAAVVFTDEQARGDLDAIIHPAVRVLAQRAEQDAIARGERVVVHDIPLLVETGQASQFDLVVVVEAPVELREDRLIATRGLTAQQAKDRIRAQASDAERRAVADVILDGSGSPADLCAQVRQLWERFKNG